MPPETATTSAMPFLDYLGRVVRVRLEAALVPHDLRPRHLVALTLLAESGPATQQDLGAALRLDPSNLVGLLNELDARDLVVRRRSPADRRRHIVELTAHGRATLDAIQGELRTVEDEVLGCLDGDDRETLAALLRRVVGDANPFTASVDEARK